MTQAFFDLIRPLFGGKMTQSQVDGVEAVMRATAGLPPGHRAYIAATAFHETGKTMQPITENLNYSVPGLMATFGRARITEAQAKAVGRSAGRPADQKAIANIVYGGEWGRKNLGNDAEGDGWRYRGRGLVQITGRANYRSFGIEATPEKASEMEAALRILVNGMTRGAFTGRKLSDYKDTDFTPMRAIVNGNDRAADIARYAKAFFDAMPHWVDVKPDPVAPAVPPSGGLIAAIVYFIKALFGGSK